MKKLLLSVALFLPFITLVHAQEMMDEDPMMMPLMEESMMDGEEITDPEAALTEEEAALLQEEGMIRMMEARMMEQKNQFQDRNQAFGELRNRWQEFPRTEKTNRLQMFRQEHPRMRQVETTPVMKNIKGQNMMYKKEGMTKGAWGHRYGNYGKNWGYIIIKKVAMLVFTFVLLFGGAFTLRRGWDMAGNYKRKK
ncbi:hypothetical protein K9L63_02120 [Candidatus Gracilibacteria bacterium]|nr:hypothetical protein [Candidatus Gracilibacteria bacterium]